MAVLIWSMICPYSKFQSLPDRVNHPWIQQRHNYLGLVWCCDLLKLSISTYYEFNGR